MKRAAAITAVLAIGVLGVLVGVLGTHLFYAHKLRRPGSFPMMAGQFFADRLDRELALSGEQRRAIADILEETRIGADALRDDLRPRIGALMEGASERISAILTPEQRERFELLREEHRGRAEHFLLGPPGPHGPPGWTGWREHRHRPGFRRPPMRPPAEPPKEKPPPEPDSDSEL